MKISTAGDEASQHRRMIHETSRHDIQLRFVAFHAVDGELLDCVTSARELFFVCDHDDMALALPLHAGIYPRKYFS
jgi:hypothetical protein